MAARYLETSAHLTLASSELRFLPGSLDSNLDEP